MKKSLLLSAVVTSVVCPTLQAQTSVWLPEPGHFTATPAYAYQTFDEFWVGKDKVKLDPYDSIQHTALVSLEYGMCPKTALDLTVGYVWSESEAFNDAHTKQTDDGVADTRFGLRYRLVDEKTAGCPWAPSQALRVGGIIKGSYEENTPWSAGDGASGLETSLLFGKAFGESGFGLYGEFGWRWRANDVPEDLFGSFGVYQSIGIVTVSAGYRGVTGLSGGDIGGTGFGTAYGFPETKEASQNVEAGVGVRDNGGRYYQIFGAKTLAGRNTGDKWVVGASITVDFGGM